jgi:hypothetical protein
MKGVEYYYKKFEEILRKDNPELAADFIAYTKIKPPLIVNLWLINNKEIIPSYDEIEPYMADFFGEIY